MNFGNIILIVSSLWLVSEIILARVKHTGAPPTGRDRSSLLLLWAAIIGGITAACVVSSYGIGQVRTGYGFVYIALVGVGLILAGLAIRWKAILTLRRFFTVDVAIAHDHRIIDSGIYSLVRHPSYTGSLMSFLGAGLLFSNWLSLLIIVIPVTAAFMYRIAVEERALAAFFGDVYAEYCARTKRLIPFIY